MTPESPKKPSEIIRERSKLRAKEWAEDICSVPSEWQVFAIEEIMTYLDEQQDAYTTGYNQALKDVQKL